MNNFESFGAHIRNLIGPFANIICLLNELSSDDTTLKKKNILLGHLLESNNINIYENTLNNLIEFSKLNELEKMNWRDTELFKKIDKDT